MIIACRRKRSNPTRKTIRSFALTVVLRIIRRKCSFKEGKVHLGGTDKGKTLNAKTSLPLILIIYYFTIHCQYLEQSNECYFNILLIYSSLSQ